MDSKSNILKVREWQAQGANLDELSQALTNAFAKFLPTGSTLSYQPKVSGSLFEISLGPIFGPDKFFPLMDIYHELLLISKESGRNLIVKALILSPVIYDMEDFVITERRGINAIIKYADEPGFKG